MQSDTTNLHNPKPWNMHTHTVRRSSIPWQRPSERATAAAKTGGFSVRGALRHFPRCSSPPGLLASSAHLTVREAPRSNRGAKHVVYTEFWGPLQQSEKAAWQATGPRLAAVDQGVQACGISSPIACGVRRATCSRLVDVYQTAK